ncbi:PHP domain-containing protein [Bacteroidota bacterium]
MKFWEQFPDKDILINRDQQWMYDYPDVNAHLHTPFSFSAFDSIDQAIGMAKAEGIKALGINDFYSMDGYQEWAEKAVKQHIFPLFNIEFIGLSSEEQMNEIRINDPNNPGRIYVSGKGLSFPVELPEPYKSELARVKHNANLQVKEMCDALNAHLLRVGLDIQFNYAEIERMYTEGIVRERHLAKALRIAVFEMFTSDQERNTILEQIFEGKEVKSAIGDNTELENEIRSKLLKAGGPAFIPENSEQFLSLEQIRELILKAGGIPTYPLLADSVNGAYTKFEENKEELMKKLVAKGIYSIEFIPNRNSMESLEEYATYFSDNGFIVTLGSEHNTPELIPIKLFDKEKKDLSETLKRINFEGAAITAAHQYLVGNGENGFLDTDGELVPGKKEELFKLGSALINYINTSANGTIEL